MRIFSYVVARDYGFAPNPFHGYCTLATCKPVIRRVAKVGDWVVGTGSAKSKRRGFLVYAMKVTEVLTFDEYWRDSRFLEKRPNLRGSVKQAYGDNVYHRDEGSGAWMQEDSHHSLKNGATNLANLETDTQSPKVLISTDFAYYGGDGPKIPTELRNFGMHDICAGHGHKSDFPIDLVENFENWFRSLDEHGYLGAPMDWHLSH
ncbi:hypothetical protein OG762_21970 [Streptomyces sp. NBC_01136]|uniref:Nmad2 family putative nucleotide modification protein n=1 Tax=unclassified Streptomyces TaxID=2593676 RepID=UPI00324F2A1F|nr:hypothetical protein OG762_21970 [Streptomyces sp. NBC_01136]